MVKEICLIFKCKDCPEQQRCCGCGHNYILIKTETNSNIYKCSKCGYKLRLNKDNPCCECIYHCKGKVKNEINKEKDIYRICNKFNKGEIDDI